MNHRPEQTDRLPLAASANGVQARAGQVFGQRWLWAVLLLLAVLPYAGILRNDFVYIYDDKAQILDNPYVHNFHHLRQVLTEPNWQAVGAQPLAAYYRPVATLGFLLCYQIFGPRAWGFHLLSLLLNAAIAALVFLLAARLLGDRRAALVAAALFALHPVHVEVLAWISAAMDLEMTLFYLLAFLCFLRIEDETGSRRLWLQAAMTASYALALLSKEPAVTLPVLATVYEHGFRADRKETSWGRKALRYGPLWLAGVGYALLRVKVFGTFAHPPGLHPLGVPQVLLSALALSGKYFGLLFAPVRLAAFYAFHASTRLDARVLAGALAVVTSAAAFGILWKRARPVAFGILWLFVTLAPVLDARWLGVYVLAERYLYLPSVGFCLVVGWAGAGLWRAAERRGRYAQMAVGAAGCLVAALGVLRIGMRLPDWQDDVTLLTGAIATEPGDYRLHDALGQAYWIRGVPEGAKREWRETLRLEPNNTQTLDSLGALYAEKRRFDLAVPLLERSLQLNPRNPDAHLNLGAAYAETGRMDRAEEQFRAAIFLAPMNFNAHNLLGKLYFDSQRFSEAEEQFRQSLQCEPNLAAYDHLGYIYAREGDYGRAEKAFRAALAMSPADSHAHFHLGLIYAATDRSAQAVEELQAALAADPGNPEIRSALEKLRH